MQNEDIRMKQKTRSVRAVLEQEETALRMDNTSLLNL